MVLVSCIKLVLYVMLSKVGKNIVYWIVVGLIVEFKCNICV